MKKFLRRLSSVADSSRHDGDVPTGHLPLHVGDEMQRFVVSAELLKHPAFVRLLNRSAAEYGYSQKGVIRIPCHVSLFERVLRRLRRGGEKRESRDLGDLISNEL